MENVKTVKATDLKINDVIEFKDKSLSTVTKVHTVIDWNTEQEKVCIEFDNISPVIVSKLSYIDVIDKSKEDENVIFKTATELTRGDVIQHANGTLYTITEIRSTEVGIGCNKTIVTVYLAFKESDKIHTFVESEQHMFKVIKNVMHNTEEDLPEHNTKAIITIYYTLENSEDVKKVDETFLFNSNSYFEALQKVRELSEEMFKHSLEKLPSTVVVKASSTGLINIDKDFIKNQNLLY